MRKDIGPNKLSDVKTIYIQTHLQGTAILDVGCGQGHYSTWLKMQQPSLSITAIDHLVLPDTQDFMYLQLDLEQAIPLPDNSFDTILAFDIIEHIAQEASFINQLHRLCKPGGMLVGSVPHDNDAFLPAYNLTFYHRSDLTHKRYYVPASLEKALNTAGFSVVTLDGKGGVSPQVIAEFFPAPLRTLVKKTVGLLRRGGIIRTDRLQSDLFFVAKKVH